LYYSTLVIFVAGLFIAVYLGAFNAAFSLGNERLLRSVLAITYATCFTRIGLLVVMVTHRHAPRWRRISEVVVCAGIAFVIFAVIVSIVLGPDALWPNLRI